jgi:hypothetical protein
LLWMTSSLLHYRERTSVLASIGTPSKGDSGHFSERSPWPMPTIHSSQHLKLLHGSIDNQQLLHRTRPNLCIRSTPIDRNLIHRQSSPETRPFQRTSFLVPKSSFRRQVQTIGKSLRHAQDMKSAASLSRKRQQKCRTAKPSPTCRNKASSLTFSQQPAWKPSEEFAKHCQGSIQSRLLFISAFACFCSFCLFAVVFFFC